MTNNETTYDANQDALSAPCAQLAEESHQQPPKREAIKAEASKRGAPAGNFSAFRHGLRSKGLALGNMPEAANHVEKRRRYFAAWLQEALEAAGIKNAPEHRVQACIIKEGQRLLIERWLRIDNEASPVETRLRLLAAAAEALEARNAIIEELGLKPAAGAPDASLPSYARGGGQ